MHFPRRPLAALALGAILAASSACDLEIGPAAAGATRGDPSAAPAAGTAEATSRATVGRTTPPPASGMFDEAAFQEDMQSAETVVNDYWATHWSSLFTGAYTPPKVVGLYNGDDPASSPVCGDAPLERDNAVYCPDGDYVAWDDHLMRTGYARGDAWVYLVIAHEWGHAIQQRLSRRLVSPAAELQADCLAGAVLYGAARDGTLQFEAGDEQEMVEAFRVIGDGSPWTRPGDHGSSAERLRNFARGGQGGVKSCVT